MKSIFKEFVPLSRYSSYRIGGAARYFAKPETAGELQMAVAKAHAERLPIFVLGGGTNLVISDEGFPGLVIKPGFKTLKDARGEVTVGAGVSMAELLKFVAGKGLAGIEWAGGLPGTVGGAIRGNAGAFGGEIKDMIVSVTSMRLGSTPTIVARAAGECGFGYRTSIFKERNGEEIILSAVFRLGKGNPKTIRGVINEKIRYRRERHPMEYPNIGSIFKNVSVEKISPELRERFAAKIKNDPFSVVPTAVILDAAELKGVSAGGAMISPKHPNFIVNTLSATAEDVKSLIRLAKSTVRGKFGIALEEEVIYV